ncbi:MULTISPECIES: hypothetical protein [unclassified Sphingomonas]|uniref:hypothetical protein n=1 Tax=unclassified Sphingomonas TaxID=196159 RepID=UPI0007006C89|nr:MULTISPECIES: hypothetical protein [unclassified Sphingomonas]KQX18373.1 hypothetical protein ASD17_14525 [Sphingomonas sp. Root1294]KQY72302.1 hypothetical protein ASD39_20450 [Sphingomonas sp. Root50]KRB94427.1 hypothetical protein ASE22_00300 [Sphingomonas sp. Root720]
MTDEPLLSTKDRPGEYDAFETLKPGEPFFLLQGGDSLTPPTILHWADLARQAARREKKPEHRKALLMKSTHAECVAWAMEEYQRGGDFDAQQRQLALDEQTMAVDDNIVLARGCDRLNNAIAEALDLADAAAMAAHVPQRGKLREAAEILRGVTRAIEPRRHMQGRTEA